MMNAFQCCDESLLNIGLFFYLRPDQLKKLRNVMVKNNTVMHEGYPLDLFTGTPDPDKTYVITLDNAKKLLAIHQRLR